MPSGRAAAWLHKKSNDDINSVRCSYGLRDPTFASRRHVAFEPQPEPPWYPVITARVMALFGIHDPELFLDSCHFSWYRSGNARCGWHADSEPIFGGPGARRPIVSLSLGAARWFEFAPSRCSHVGYSHPRRKAVHIQHGDVVVMALSFQDAYVHRVPRETDVREPRLNLTWR